MIISLYENHFTKIKTGKYVEHKSSSYSSEIKSVNYPFPPPPHIHEAQFTKEIHRIHKWWTRGKKLVPSHESEALEDKQKLQMKTFSELAEC